MKILYIANIRIPTTKAHGFQIMKNMCSQLGDQGVQVELVVPTRRNKEFKNIDPFKFYQVKKNFKLKKILAYDPKWLIRFPSGTYIKFQALIFMTSLFFYLLFKKNKGEYILYTRDEYLLPILQLFSTTVVWEGHSLPRRKKHYLKYFKKCHRIIVLTDELKKMLVKLGVKENRVLVSPDAVDLEIFGIIMDKRQARKKLKLPEDKILLGYTGTFKTKNMDKGLSGIIHALKKVVTKYPDAIFVAVGGAREHIDEYRELASSLGVEKNCLFLGRVDTSELAIYQQAFDMCLMPFPWTEHYAYFMSPLKMFENMASGRPIIATNLPTIKEVLNDNNSLLVKPDNRESLAVGIVKLIEDKELGSRLANNALKDIKEYTWQKRVEKIIKYINETP